MIGTHLFGIFRLSGEGSSFRDSHGYKSNAAPKVSKTFINYSPHFTVIKLSIFSGYLLSMLSCYINGAANLILNMTFGTSNKKINQLTLPIHIDLMT